MVQDSRVSEVVKERQAAQLLGRAVQTLRNDRHLRQGPPYIKLGRSIRYRVCDLMDYLDKHRVEPEAV